jgi:ribosomal protein L34E
MLRQGATLSEIGELLRHRSPQTTAIYAKVDTVSLVTLALPWPGGALRLHGVKRLKTMSKCAAVLDSDYKKPEPD